MWYGYGSEHSANLVIIGKFESASDAETAYNLLQELTNIAIEDEREGNITAGQNLKQFSEPMLKCLTQYNFGAFGYQDPEQLIYEYGSKLEDNKIILTTEELNIQAFLKIFLNYGAKVETYSAHNYESNYGRNTIK